MDYPSAQDLYPLVQDLTEVEYSIQSTPATPTSTSTSCCCYPDSSTTASSYSTATFASFSLQELVIPTTKARSLPSPHTSANNYSPNNNRNKNNNKGHKRGSSLFNFSISSSSKHQHPPPSPSQSPNSNRDAAATKKKHRRSHSSPTTRSESTASSTSFSVMEDLLCSEHSLENEEERVTTIPMMTTKFEDVYVLTRQIYRCKVSTLWECVDREEGNRYCVKIIDRRRYSSYNDEDSALKEISILSFLQEYNHHHHDGVDDDNNRLTQMVQVTEDLHHYYIVMELIEGTNLATWLQQQQQQKAHALPAPVSPPQGGTAPRHHRSLSSPLVSSEDYHYYENGATPMVGPYSGTIMSSNGGGSSMEHAGAANASTLFSPMTESQVQRLTRSLLKAVQQLHSLNICHNDIQPENIMLNLDKEDDAILCDFGSARFVNDQNSNDDLMSLSLSSSSSSQGGRHHRQGHRRRQSMQSVLGGNLNYAAPELLRHYSHTGPNACALASDMWSIGVIVFQCLCGALPFDDVASGGGSSRSLNGNSTVGTGNGSTISAAGSSARTSSSSNSSHHSSSNNSSSTNVSRRSRLKENIVKGNYSFVRKEWRFVTRGAKQFISSLLHPDPHVRMTVEEALAHPWLAVDSLPLLVHGKKNHHTSTSATATKSTSNHHRTMSASASSASKSKRKRRSLVKLVLGSITKSRSNSPTSPTSKKCTVKEYDLKTASSTLSSVGSMEEVTRQRQQQLCA